MLPRNMDLTKRFITVLSAGEKWVSSTRYLQGLQLVRAFLNSCKLMPHTSVLLRACSISLTSFEETMKGDVPRRIGRTKGGLNSKLHAVCDGQGRPVVLLLSEGQMSDYKGARLIVDVLPPVKCLLADRDYDADWFRDALREKGIKPCIPAKKNRKQKIKFNGKLYKQPHKVENMFGKLKDWRRVATRYDRCAHTFFSTICIAAFVIFYLNQ